MSYKYSETKILKAIKDSGGIITVIQKRLGCVSWLCAKQNIEKFESTRQAYLDEKEKILDIAESSLVKSIQEGNTQDGKWYLSKKGKERGYADEVPIVNVNNVTSQNTDVIKQNLDKLTPEERDLYLELCEKINVADSE